MVLVMLTMLLFMPASSLSPLGLMVSGFVAERIGIATWFAVCGLLVAACCAAGFLNRRIRELDPR